MQVIYEKTEIDLQISSCKIIDNIKGKADSLAISFADIKRECRKWEFAKNHVIEIVDSPFSTGSMYVDGFECSNGNYNVNAISIKKNYKTKKTRTWENVNFLDLAKDLVTEIGLTLETYGVSDFQYERVDQVERNNIEFLRSRCILEGCVLKISNGKALIISEDYLKNQSSVLTLNPSLFLGKYKFKCTSNNIYGGCEVSSFSKDFIKGSFIYDSAGEVIQIKDINISSLGEGNRFAKNILKSFNKNEITGMVTIVKNTNIAAGSAITIEDLDLYNGKYIIEDIMHDLIDNKSNLTVRRVLEGY